MTKGEASSFSIGLPELDPKEACRPGEDQPDADTDQDIEEDVDEGDGASTRSKGRIPNKNEVQKEHALEAGFKCMIYIYNIFDVHSIYFMYLAAWVSQIIEF